jgi:hypothetical protein
VAKKRSKSPRARGKKKAARPRKSTRKAYAPKQIDFNPIKAQLRKHIERLSAIEHPDERMKMQNTLERLKRVQLELTEMCAPTMAIPIP